MKQTVVVDHELGYGLGIFSVQLPCGRFWGHNGDILDYGTIVAASDNGDSVSVISARGDAPIGSPRDETALLCRPRRPTPANGPPSAPQATVVRRLGQERTIGPAFGNVP